MLCRMVLNVKSFLHNMIKILFSLLLFVLLLWILGSIVVWSIRNGISPMPTSLKAKRKLLHCIPVELQGPVYELGSGWGTLAIPIAQKLPKCQVVGYETSPVPFFVSMVRKRLSHLNNLTLHKKDFFKESIDDAALVVCYLYPGAMRKLKKKFQNELKPGTLVISNTFAIPGWVPEKVVEVEDLYKTKIYIYRLT